MADVRRRRPRRIDPDMYDAIVELAPRFSAKQIVEELQRRFERDWYPSRRTVQDVIREVTPASDEGESWTVATADPEDVPLVLPVLADLIRNSDGVVTGFGLETGRWIAKLRRAVPDIPAGEALHLAIYYQMAAKAERPTYNLDIYLALQLWRSPKERMDAFRRGWLPSNWQTAIGRKG